MSVQVFILILFALIVVVIISIYNLIIRRRNEVDNAFGSIDVMLKKRFDLLPNLLEITKQFMNHERDLFTEITALRSQVNATISADEKIKKYNELQKYSDSILLSVENYPELKSDQSFINLQKSWNTAEEQISAARRYYNTTVTQYNNSIDVFPSNLIARYFGFINKEVFEAETLERENINASELFSK